MICLKTLVVLRKRSIAGNIGFTFSFNSKFYIHYCLKFFFFPIPSNRYTFSSIETQIRILGDYAFILQDYELALSNYRLLSTDYKLDKAWKRYAGVQVPDLIILLH